MRDKKNKKHHLCPVCRYVPGTSTNHITDRLFKWHIEGHPKVEAV